MKVNIEFEIKTGIGPYYVYHVIDDWQQSPATVVHDVTIDIVRPLIRTWHGNHGVEIEDKFIPWVGIQSISWEITTE